jgi:hypothetical protein
MENINTYLRWRGDLKISKRHPLNIPDAVILARISYLPFDKIILDNHETVFSATEKMLKLKPKDFRWPDDSEFVKNLNQSRRFSPMRLTHYMKNNNKDIEQQFSAITVHLGGTSMYLSFFGTDDTITGWKEDFNLTILDVIPAQKIGAEYTRTLMRRYPHKKVYLGGHSKGGNIAMYAAITMPDQAQYRLKSVFNFDGPGLREDIRNLDKGVSVLPKIHSYIPQGSIIGRLLNHAEEFTVVESTAKGIYQHDVYSWIVDRDHFRLSTTTKASDFANDTIDRWLASASIEERKIFLDGMFGVFQKNDIDNPVIFIQNWTKALPKVLKSYRNIPKEERKIITSVWKKLGQSFMATRRAERPKH